jgi:hypothetical protein
MERREHNHDDGGRFAPFLADVKPHLPSERVWLCRDAVQSLVSARPEAPLHRRTRRTRCGRGAAARRASCGASRCGGRRQNGTGRCGYSSGAPARPREARSGDHDDGGNCQRVQDQTAALRLSKRVWLCRDAIHHAATLRLAHGPPRRASSHRTGRGRGAAANRCMTTPKPHPPQNLPIERTITPPSMERTDQR